MNKISLNLSESIYKMFEIFRKSLYLKISMLIFLLIGIVHFGWIFDQVLHDDMWYFHTFARKSLSSVLEIQSLIFESPTYRFLHVPLLWFLNIFFGSNGWMYNFLNIFLHFLNVIILGKIIHNKTRSIEIASLSLIFFALLPTAVTVFGMRHLFSTVAVLPMLICLYVFQKRGVTLLSAGIGFLVLLIALSIYEAPFPLLAVFGFLIVSKKDRLRYLLFLSILSFCYLLPNLIFFPKYKLWCLEQRKLNFLSVIKFILGPGSFIYICGVFKDRINGLSWGLVDILKIAISTGLACFIWNYAGIGKITKESAEKGYRNLFFCSVSIILPFIITCVLTGFQTVYLYYVPSFGFFLLVTSALILFLRKKVVKKVVFPAMLVIVILSNMVLLSSQKMWRDVAKVRVALFLFLDKYEENIPKKSSIVFVNLPRVWQIPDFLYNQGWIMQNIIEWKYDLERKEKTDSHRIIEYYSGVYSADDFSKIFSQSDTIEIDSMSLTEKNKHISFSDIYLVGFDNQGFYPVSEIFIYDNEEKNVIKSSDFVSKNLADFRPLHIVDGKGIREVIYHPSVQ